MLKKLIRNILYLLTQALNTVTLGDPGEYFSSRIAKARNRGSELGTFLANNVDKLFALWGDDNHCERSIQPDEGKHEIWRM